MSGGWNSTEAKGPKIPRTAVVEVKTDESWDYSPAYLNHLLAGIPSFGSGCGCRNPQRHRPHK